jgi:hypothetical protein
MWSVSSGPRSFLQDPVRSARFLYTISCNLGRSVHRPFFSLSEDLRSLGWCHARTQAGLVYGARRGCLSVRRRCRFLQNVD